jgi:hypothetical protein
VVVLATTQLVELLNLVKAIMVVLLAAVLAAAVVELALLEELEQEVLRETVELD